MFSFKKKSKIILPEIKVDMHSHLIPGIDDGSQSLEESMSIIKGLYELGIRKIITTPHIMADFYRNTPEIIRSGTKIVQEALSKELPDVSFDAAAEYYLDEFFLQDLKDGKEMLLIDNKFLLFELPFMTIPRQLNEAIFEMQTRGYKPILAHPERYNYYEKNINALQELKDKGVLLQLNWASIIGYYSKGSKKLAIQLLKNNMIDFIGSDIHNPQQLPALKASMNNKTAALLNNMSIYNNSLLNA